MVGDDAENDYVAPVRFGWKAFHLDRRATDQRPQHVISDLSQLF